MNGKGGLTYGLEQLLMQSLQLEIWVTYRGSMDEL